MDVLNKTFTQVKTLFGSMTPGARVTTGLLLAVVVVSVGFLFRQKISGSQEYLLGGRALSPSEIGAIEAAFAKANLDNYSVEGNRVRIPCGKKAAYIGAMADGQALPADFNVYLDEAISSGSPFESRDQRDTRLKVARQKELALIIRSWKDIESAAVQFDMVEQGTFPRKKDFTAMVAVRPVGSGELDEERVRSIRHLVSSAIAGLKPENVTVSDLNAGRSYPGTSGDGLGPEGNVYAAAKREHERAYTKKVRDVLAYVKGAVIAVNVELDPEMYGKTTTIEYDKQPVSYESNETTRSSTSADSSVAGRPGLGSQQQPNEPRQIAQPSSQQNVEETTSRQHSVVGHDVTTSTKAPLIPTRVAVAISIPTSYFREVWHNQKAASGETSTEEPTATELAEIERQITNKIEDQIASLLPAKRAEDVYPLVKVSSYEPPATEDEVDSAASASIVTWLADHWSTLAMAGMGLFSLLLVRGMIRSATPAPAEPSSEPAAAATATAAVSTPKRNKTADSEDASEKEAVRVLSAKFGNSGPNLRDELVGLVQQDPDAAASILSNWIGSAS